MAANPSARGSGPEATSEATEEPGPESFRRPRHERAGGSFLHRTVVVALVAVVAFALLGVLRQASQIFLLVFAGLLLTTLIRALSEPLAARTRLPDKAAVALVSLGLAGLLTAATLLLAPQVARQIDELSRRLPEAAGQLLAQAKQYAWVRQLLEATPSPGKLLSERRMLTGATGVLSTTFGVLGGLLVMLFTGLYVAFEPGVYRKGLLRLVPPERRPRAVEILGEMNGALRGWLLGKALSMTVVGVLVWAGLAWLGVPLALTLGLLAGLLSFVPNFGPVIAAVPPLLLGLMQGPMTALYVGVLYLAIQTVESYLLTPMVQRQTISLPPALLLGSQLVMAALFGFLGLVVAVPLTAALLVLVRRVYVNDLLGDREGEPAG